MWRQDSERGQRTSDRDSATELTRRLSPAGQEFDWDPEGGLAYALLAEEGFREDELARIRTPIGLDIGARSAAEIALAVAAEIVAVRAGRAVSPIAAADASVSAR